LFCYSERKCLVPSKTFWCESLLYFIWQKRDTFGTKKKIFGAKKSFFGVEKKWSGKKRMFSPIPVPKK
jgi:hypothetical protein